MMGLHRIKGRLAVAVALAAMTIAAGCGSGSSTPASSGSNTSAAAHVDLNALYKGTYHDPPSTAPRHQPGKKIYLISCGQSIPFCSDAVSGAQQAAAALGWSTTVVDSKGDTNAAGEGIRQAIAARADGIFVYSLDCQYIKQPLVEAKRAGIPVTTAEARDCNQDLRFQPTAGPQLFTSVVSYSEGPLVNWLQGYGKAQAEYMLAKVGDHMNSVSFYFGELGTSLTIQDSFSKYLASACPNCKGETVPFTIAEATTGLEEKAQQALLRNPNADAIRVDSDGTLTGGVLAAAKATAPKALIMAGEGQAAIMNLIRAGNTKVAGGVGTAVVWEGWSAIDGLLRAFAHKPAVSSGIGIQVWGPGHNTPPSGAYVPPIDFRAKYKQAWGVG